MTELVMAAAWSFVGGVVYSGGRLATALWGGKEIEARARRLAWAQFALSLLLAPAAGAAGTEIVLDLYPQARLASTALVIGIMINVVATVMTDPTFVREMLSALLRGAADRLSGASKP